MSRGCLARYVPPSGFGSPRGGFLLPTRPGLFHPGGARRVRALRSIPLPEIAAASSAAALPACRWPKPRLPGLHPSGSPLPASQVLTRAAARGFPGFRSPPRVGFPRRDPCGSSSHGLQAGSPKRSRPGPTESCSRGSWRPLARSPPPPGVHAPSPEGGSALEHGSHSTHGDDSPGCEEGQRKICMRARASCARTPFEVESTCTPVHKTAAPAQRGRQAVDKPVDNRLAGGGGDRRRRKIPPLANAAAGRRPAGAQRRFEASSASSERSPRLSTTCAATAWSRNLCTT